MLFALSNVGLQSLSPRSVELYSLLLQVLPPVAFDHIGPSVEAWEAVVGHTRHRTQAAGVDPLLGWHQDTAGLYLSEEDGALNAAVLAALDFEGAGPFRCIQSSLGVDRVGWEVDSSK